jgi:hypothetical protein
MPDAACAGAAALVYAAMAVHAQRRGGPPGVGAAPRTSERPGEVFDFSEVLRYLAPFVGASREFASPARRRL